MPRNSRGNRLPDVCGLDQVLKVLPSPAYIRCAMVKTSYMKPRSRSIRLPYSPGIMPDKEFRPWLRWAAGSEQEHVRIWEVSSSPGADWPVALRNPYSKLGAGF